MAKNVKENATIIIMIVALLLVGYFLTERKPQKMQIAYSEARAEKLNEENKSLKEALYNCNENGLLLLKQIDSLRELIPVKKVAVATTPRPQVRTQPTENRLVIDVRVNDQRETPVRQVYQEPVIAKAYVPEARTAFISSETETAFPSFYYEEKVIKMCLRLGGDNNRHLPHLGIFDGIIAQDNSISGYNWVLTPTETITGDWGITRDGTFYVSIKLVDRYITKSDKGIVEIKAPATNWLPVKMKKNDNPNDDCYGYYTYKKVSN